MKAFDTLLTVGILIALMAACAAGAGLFWQDAGQPFSFTTLRGQTVEIYGQGLYRNDTTLIAIGYRITYGFTLLAGIPLLLVSLWLYRRGSQRGRILLSGVLAYLLYNYGSLALGAAYNNLLLVYIALTAVTLYGFVASVMPFDQRSHTRQSLTRHDLLSWRTGRPLLVVHHAIRWNGQSMVRRVYQRAGQL